jgi:hypothetical protein
MRLREIAPQMSVYDLIGVIGAVIAISAYFATQQGWLRATDWLFPFANLIAAIMILVSLSVDWNLPAVVIECFWLAISVYGLIRFAMSRK